MSVVLYSGVGQERRKMSCQKLSHLPPSELEIYHVMDWASLISASHQLQTAPEHLYYDLTGLDLPLPHDMTLKRPLP